MDKPVNRLTLADLEASAIWEYTLDEGPGRDETWVRPRSDLARATGRGELVRTRFVAASGRLYTGFAVAASARDLPTVQPVIVTPAGTHVGFWAGALPFDDLSASYAALDTVADELFPMTFRSDVPTLGKPVFGELLGFGHYGEDRSIVIAR